MIRSAVRGCGILVVALLGAVVVSLVPGCGEDGFSLFDGTGADGGSSGTFGPPVGSDGSAPDGAASGADRCGGAPCSNYTGSKDFTEPGAPGDAASLFGGAALQANGTNAAQEP
jgi:hypothetical protein